ncbi:MAG: radical SAM protein [Deltaproteobacteria bacterium]|nr:radical SAM protein [Deltaproteobacteria bacterium]
MGKCNSCDKSAKNISNTIGFCADCIRAHFEDVWPQIKAVHDRSRRAYGLPVNPPNAADGVACGLCVHDCKIPENSVGFCGLRRVQNRRIFGGRPHEGNLSYYYNPLPTNCVGDFVCPGGTGCGYPRYAATKGPEYGYKNLAVFYHACGFNCLYCQNYHFKTKTFHSQKLTAKRLAQAVDPKTNCICYFGGDPTPQILHAIKTSKMALKYSDHQILRICWETNGSMQTPFLNMMADLSLNSGGCVKFDLKAWDEGIHLALCGVTNQRTLENFRILARRAVQRPEPPFLIASTLLVPGYVDEHEVENIASFISSLNPEIPYSLLAFYPHFYLNDLPTTSKSHALRCKHVAEKAGLKNVRIGNIHLLSPDVP